MNLEDDHSNLGMPKIKSNIWKLWLRSDFTWENNFKLYCYSPHDYLEPLGILYVELHTTDIS